MAKLTGLSRRGIEWNLKKLQDKGIVHRVNGKAHGYWEIPLESEN